MDEADIQQQTLADLKARVIAYLNHMEARDLAAARAVLAQDFVMIFPGACPMRTLEQLIAWASARYRFVAKTVEAVEAFESTVYVRGTLRGEWTNGAPFAGIRFIDRFELRAGKITRQDVWNDLAEVRPR